MSATNKRKSPRTKCLVAKVGLDGHNLGAKLVACALRDAGLEVVYAEFLTPDELAQIAVQEDVAVVGISILSGAHMTLVPDCLDELRKRGLADVSVVVGGTIPVEDFEALKSRGVAEVWGPGTPTEVIVASVARLCR